MKIFRRDGFFRREGFRWLLGMFVLFIPFAAVLADDEILLTMPFSESSTVPASGTDSRQILSTEDPIPSTKTVTIKRSSDDAAAAVPSVLTPESVLRLLAAGNAEVIGDAAEADDLPVLSTDDDRFPAVTVLYSDGASLPTDIFGLDEGDVYQVPLRAGVCTAEEMDDFEYGIVNLRTPLAVILTDYPNPDVRYMVENYDRLKGIAERQLAAAKKNPPKTFTNNRPVDDDVLLYTLVGPAVARAKAANPDMSDDDMITVVSEAIAWQSVETILSESDAACDLIRNKQLKLVAAMVDNVSGRVHWLGEHPLQKEFLKEIPKDVKAKREKSTVIVESEVTDPLPEERIVEYIEGSEMADGGCTCCQYIAPYYMTIDPYVPCWRLFYPRCWYYRPWYGCGVTWFVPYPYFDPWYYGYGPYVPYWNRPWYGFHLGFAVGFGIGLHIGYDFRPWYRHWDRPWYRHPWSHRGWDHGGYHDRIYRMPHHGPAPGHRGGPGGYGRPDGPGRYPGVGPSKGPSRNIILPGKGPSGPSTGPGKGPGGPGVDPGKRPGGPGFGPGKRPDDPGKRPGGPGFGPGKRPSDPGKRPGGPGFDPGKRPDDPGKRPVGPGFGPGKRPSDSGKGPDGPGADSDKGTGDPGKGPGGSDAGPGIRPGDPGKGPAGPGADSGKGPGGSDSDKEPGKGLDSKGADKGPGARPGGRDSNGRYIPGGYRPDGKGGGSFAPGSRPRGKGTGNFGPGNRPGGARGDTKIGGSDGSVPSRPGISTHRGGGTTKRPGSNGASRGKAALGDNPGRINGGGGDLSAGKIEGPRSRTDLGNTTDAKRSGDNPGRIRSGRGGENSAGKMIEARPRTGSDSPVGGQRDNPGRIKSGRSGGNSDGLVRGPRPRTGSDGSAGSQRLGDPGHIKSDRSGGNPGGAMEGGHSRTGSGGPVGGQRPGGSPGRVNGAPHGGTGHGRPGGASASITDGGATFRSLGGDSFTGDRFSAGSSGSNRAMSVSRPSDTGSLSRGMLGGSTNSGRPVWRSRPIDSMVSGPSVDSINGGRSMGSMGRGPSIDSMGGGRSMGSMGRGPSIDSMGGGRSMGSMAAAVPRWAAV